MLCRDRYNNTKKWCRNSLYERRYTTKKNIRILAMFLLTNNLIQIYSPIGIGSVHGPTGDTLAYLFVWTSTFIIKPSSIAVITLTFSQYFLSGIMNSKIVFRKKDFAKNKYLDCGPSEELVKLLAIFMIRMYIPNFNKHSVYLSFSVILININSISVSVANRTNIVFVICKVLTILTIIIASLVRIGQGLFSFWLKKK